MFDKDWLEHPENRKLPEVTLSAKTTVKGFTVGVKCGYDGACSYKGAAGECGYSKVCKDKRIVGVGVAENTEGARN
jgi:hypothetical protein